jgi:hypothetical protein
LARSESSEGREVDALDELVALDGKQPGAPAPTRATEAQKLWRQDLLSEAQRSATLRGKATLGAGGSCGAPAAAGGVMLAAVPATAVRREAETILFHTNLRSVSLEGIQNQMRTPAAPDLSSAKRCSNYADRGQQWDGRGGSSTLPLHFNSKSDTCMPASRKAPSVASSTRSRQLYLLPREGSSAFRHKPHTPLEELRAARSSGTSFQVSLGHLQTLSQSNDIVQ